MLEIPVEAVCEAPVSAAFDYVADYRNTTKYLHGLSKFDPVNDRNQGLGAVFDGTLRLGPVAMSSRVEYVQWDEPVVIHAKAIEGLDTSFTYRFTSLGALRSRINLLIEVNFLGVAGKAMSKGIAPFLDAAAKKTGAQLASQVTDFYSTQRTA